jgi:Phosphoesterase family
MAQGDRFQQQRRASSRFAAGERQRCICRYTGRYGANYVETGSPTELGIPYGGLAHTPVPPHFQTLDDLMSQAAAGTLPSVAFVDFGLDDSEHPPADIRAGEAQVASVINAVRTGPNWPNSLVIWTYDEQSRRLRSRHAAECGSTGRDTTRTVRRPIKSSQFGDPPGTAPSATTALPRHKRFAPWPYPAKLVRALINTVSDCPLSRSHRFQSRATYRIRSAITPRF